MSLLPNNTFASPGNPLYSNGGGGAGQTLSQTGNTVSLSGGGGSVDIAATTTVAATATKTTAMTYNGGLLSTSIVGDLFVERTEIGTPLNPQPLSVNGDLFLFASIIDNNDSSGGASQVLTAGTGGQVVWANAPASTWVGTATSDLNMASYNIKNANTLAFAGTTPVVKYNVTTTSAPFTNMVPYFGASYTCNVPDGVAGYASGQAIILSGCSDPAFDGPATVDSIIDLNTLLINNITAPYLGLPVFGFINIVSYKGLIEANGNDITVGANNTGLIKIRSEGVGGGAGVAIQTTSAPIVLSSNNEIQISADGDVVIESSAIVSVSNPTAGVGGAQLNVNGSASIRGDTAQLQILDGDGIQQGSLSYNVIDGQTHFDAKDLAVSSGTAINVTSQNDLTLYAETGNVTITAHEASIGLDSHTDIGISCNNGGTIRIGGANTTNAFVTAQSPTAVVELLVTNPIDDIQTRLSLDGANGFSVMRAYKNGVGDVTYIGDAINGDATINAPHNVAITAGTGNIELTTTAGTGNDIKLVAENGVFIQALNALLDIEGANAVKVQSGGILDLIGQSGDASIQLGSGGACTVTATGTALVQGQGVTIDGLDGTALVQSKDNLTIQAGVGVGAGGSLFLTTGNSLFIQGVPSLTTGEILHYDHLTGGVSYGANALPSGLISFASLNTVSAPVTVAWAIVNGYWTSTISVPGMLSNSKISATLQLTTGYASTDADRASSCWLIATVPDTDSLSFIVASDPTGDENVVLISWAIVG